MSTNKYERQAAKHLNKMFPLMKLDAEYFAWRVKVTAAEFAQIDAAKKIPVGIAVELPVQVIVL